MHKLLRNTLIFATLLIAAGVNKTFGSSPLDPATTRRIDREVVRLMEKGEIPGLSLVIVDGNRTYIKSFGYADLAQKRPVDARTLFEAGSCTKAFTALALLQLEQQGLVELDSPVTRYLPWFRTFYKDSLVAVTLRQLMHHTSGIPTHTLSLITAGNGKDALENTVKGLAGTPLNHRPGERFEYASSNYDVLGLVIEEKTGQPFESYLRQHLLGPLGMHHSGIGYTEEKRGMAQGYKTGYFEPRAYTAPLYRGNNPAGYLVTNATDLAAWLQFQLGIRKTGTALDHLLARSRERDESVPVNQGAPFSYAAGWEVYLDGRGTVSHGGLNPAFSAYTGFIPGRQLGLGILTNSNSPYTGVISQHLFDMLLGKAVPVDPPAGGMDRDFSLVTFALAAYVLAVLLYLVYKLYAVYKGRSGYRPCSRRSAGKLAAVLLPLGLLLTGIYLLPGTLAGFTWEATLVWAPVSFAGMVAALILSMFISYLAYVADTLFPDTNVFVSVAPKVIVLSLLSGMANAAIIVLITYAISNPALGDSNKLGYLVFYFSTAFLMYVMGRKVVQTKLIRLTAGLIYDVRMQLFNTIFASSYQDFEKMDRGSIYATLDNDTDVVGGAANVVVNLITNVITAIAVFIYLIAISPEAAAVTILTITLISGLYYLIGRESNRLFEAVRDTATRYLELLSGMIDGFKELSIHARARRAYKRDLEDVNEEFQDKMTTVRIKLVNGFLVGESLLVLLLAVVAFSFNVIFPALAPGAVLSYIVVMLYLIGPINIILASIPSVMQIRVSWNRIQKFMREMQVHTRPAQLLPYPEHLPKTAQHLSVAGLRYRYQGEADQKGFAVGPITFELKSGEAVFITGGNGSGKTTLSRLLTGLYNCTEGHIVIDGKTVAPRQLGEYFSVVFSPFYLFRKLYSLNPADKAEQVDAYLRVLGLHEKVRIAGNAYSTIDLSQGQRKRLALLQCYLEDRPICLLDEWAADQDPDYRKFFYKTLLPEMKRRGKMLIVISHDDHYFGEADQIIRLRDGQQELAAIPDQLVS